MARQVTIASGVLATSIAHNGTFTISYPSGTNQATFTGADAGTDHQIVLNKNDVWKASASKMSLTFGGGSITVTNLSGVSWPAGTGYDIQIAKGDTQTFTGVKGATITALTSAAGTPGTGTADVTGSFSQSILNNNFASIVANQTAIINALKAAGIIS